MATGQGLYSQLVVLRWKDLKFTEANKNKNKSKFKFQGQSSISQRWFDLDYDWAEVNFRTLEHKFYGKLIKIHDNTKDTNTSKIFQVPIGNLKCVEKIKVHSDAPMLKYRQKLLNSCCFSILESSFDGIKKPIPPILYHFV